MTIRDDELNIRPLVETLLRYWRRILVLGIGLAVLAMSVSLLQKRRYEATASILLTRTRANLELARQFPTIVEPIDTRSRMDAILIIANSDQIAFQIFDEFKDRFPEEEQELTVFQNLVEVTNIGDALLVTSQARDPVLAADVANEWARLAAEAINLGYSGDQPLPEIQAQLTIARGEYHNSQGELENFLGGNQIRLLENRIMEAQTLLDRLADDRATQILYYDARKHVLEEVIVQANALRSQLQEGNNSTAGQLGDAIAVLQARAFGLDSTPTQPKATAPLFELQLTDLIGPQDLTSGYIADLDVLITRAEVEKSSAEAALESLSADVLVSEVSEEIAQASAQLSQLETLLEQEQATKLELISNRDLAWEAYQALAQKEVEIKNEPQSDNLVTLASPAIPPPEPLSRGTILNTLIGGFVGVIVAASWAFGEHWWRTGSPETSS